jgi:hypothetical protein
MTSGCCVEVSSSTAQIVGGVELVSIDDQNR